MIILTLVSLTAFSLAVNTSFIGTIRNSPFLVYPARTVIVERRKSTSF
jgi:hypothetical protein